MIADFGAYMRNRWLLGILLFSTLAAGQQYDLVLEGGRVMARSV